MEDFVSQQDQDGIFTEALRQCVEAGNHDMEEFEAESAQMCLKMVQMIQDHRTALRRLVDTIEQSTEHLSNVSYDEVKFKLDKFCSIQIDYFDKQHKRYCYGFSREEDGPQANDQDCKEEITLDIGDTLDKRIKEYRDIIKE